MIGKVTRYSKFEKIDSMKTQLKLEEVCMFIMSYAFAWGLGFPWWAFFAWLLAPDISLIGYLVNTKIGAILYNLAHHKGVAILVCSAGLYLVNREMQFAGILLFGHSSMDRILGYGLKYPDNFKNTHLGWIGPK